MSSLIERLEGLRPGASRRTLRHLLDHGRVLVDGRPARRGSEPVPDGAEVRILPRDPRARAAAPFRILFEDSHLLIVDKPAGLLTVSARREGRSSVWSALRRLLRERRPPEEAHLVHRLDEAASGLLVFAKTERCKTALKALFAGHDVERVYDVVVRGTIERSAGEFRSRLVETPDRMHHVRSLRRGDPEDLRAAAREALTRWLVRGRGAGVTALEARLETGRKHQIRVQFAEAGHPVVGDRLYGGPRAARLYLHARVLGFRHPVTGKRVRVEARPGREFDAAAQGPPAPAGGSGAAGGAGGAGRPGASRRRGARPTRSAPR